ncbi:hypothetical protein J2S43_006151 [Catenuloplanes nepalensis]|uniref:Uncharacterized protein n=1 Tax=Catenuloplanes nepalensis TaxID=587533 RepID=A0ABT9N1R9_9ACTN|nr:hypothetical protein [Catenuloplanes nepalensis]
MRGDPAAAETRLPPGAGVATMARMPYVLYL